MEPGKYVRENTKLSTYKKLAVDLFPEVTMAELSFLKLSDHRGRNAKSMTPLSFDSECKQQIDFFINEAMKAGVLEKPEEPLLQGKDLLPYCDAGPELGSILKKAYQIQINENINDKNMLLQRCIKNLKF